MQLLISKFEVKFWPKTQHKWLKLNWRYFKLFYLTLCWLYFAVAVSWMSLNIFCYSVCWFKFNIYIFWIVSLNTLFIAVGSCKKNGWMQQHSRQLRTWKSHFHNLLRYLFPEIIFTHFAVILFVIASEQGLLALQQLLLYTIVLLFHLVVTYRHTCLHVYNV